MTTAPLKNIMLTGPFLVRDDSKLNLGLNESAYQIPDSIKRRVLSSLDRLHNYPLGHQERVLELVARHHGVKPGNVAITRGVDEAQDRLIELFPRMRYIIFSPTFLGYEARLRLTGVDYTVFPLTEDFGIREQTFSEIGKNDFVILANPNNPTGTMLEPAALDRLAGACGKLLVDEAYIEYSGRESMLARLGEDTFVFRSLSKTFALAGQRLGFLFGGERAMETIKDRQWFCNVDVLSLDIIASILEEPFMAHYAALIMRDRALLREALRGMGFDVRQSFTNFLLLRSARAREIIDHLNDRGITVMDTTVFGLANHVRVTVGTPEQNQVFLDAMRELSQRW